MSAAVAPNVSTNLPNNPDTAASNSSPMDSKRIESEGELSTRVSLAFPRTTSINTPYGRDQGKTDKIGWKGQKENLFYRLYHPVRHLYSFLGVGWWWNATSLLYVHHPVL